MSKKRHSKQFNKQTYFSGAVIFQMEKEKNKTKEKYLAIQVREANYYISENNQTGLSSLSLFLKANEHMNVQSIGKATESEGKNALGDLSTAYGPFGNKMKGQTS